MLLKKDIIIEGLSIRYYQSERLDKDSPLVFLHGWGSQALHFRKTLEKCKNFIAIDLPGFGNSQAPKTPWSLSDYVILVHNFLEKTNIKNPILAGHSFGGSIEIKYCTQFNDAKKLILIGSAGTRRKTLQKYFFLLLAKILGTSLSLPGIRFFRNGIRRRFYKAIDSEDYINAGVLADTYKKIISEDLREDMKKIHTPTVIIWGLNDKETRLEDGRLMEKLIQGSKFYTVPDAGHYCFLENEKAFENIFLPNIL
jgi:pimeloyl-ACP methyl ester carboxylesterase